MALTPRDKRALMILGGAAVVGIVLLFVFVLGGGEEQRAGGPPAGSTGTRPSPEATATPTPREASPRELTFSGRDPFSPPAVLVSPSGGASPTTPPPTSPPGGGPGPGGHAGGKDVTLLDVSADGTQATISVNGNSDQLSVGEEFRGVTLESIDGDCVDLSVDGDSLTLCTGK